MLSINLLKRHEDTHTTHITHTHKFSQEVIDAKGKEIMNLIQNDVFEEEKDAGQSS